VTGPLQGPDASLRVAGGRGSFRSLAGSVWPGLPEAPLLVVPLGSLEQHGHHLPLGTEALTGLLVEYGRSAGRWAGRVLLVNGHGGNLDALRAAVPVLRSEGRDVAWFPCGVAGGDAHAGRTETSLMLHVEPGAVGEDRAAGETTPIGYLLPRLRAEGVRAVSPTGVLGDPAGASRAEGAALLADMTARLVAAARAWTVDGAGRLEG
jgi:mycofactocin system creatininase family protein